jgi:hypothetical protein
LEEWLLFANERITGLPSLQKEGQEADRKKKSIERL